MLCPCVPDKRNSLKVKCPLWLKHGLWEIGHCPWSRVKLQVKPCGSSVFLIVDVLLLLLYQNVVRKVTRQTDNLVWWCSCSGYVLSELSSSMFFFFSVTVEYATQIRTHLFSLFRPLPFFLFVFSIGGLIHQFNSRWLTAVPLIHQILLTGVHKWRLRLHA